RSDEMPPLGFQQPGRAEDRQVVALRPAARENNLAWLASQHLGRAIPRIIQNRPRPPANMVHAAGIAVDSLQKRQHRLPHLGIQGSRGVVIEINRPHVTTLTATLRTASRKWGHGKSSIFLN